MKNKINLRLSLIALIAIVCTALGVTIVYYNFFQDQIHNDLHQNAQLLMETDVFQRIYNSDDEDTRVLNRLSSDNLRITWIDKDGTVLFDNDTNADDMANHMDRPEIQEAFQCGEGESIRQSDTFKLNTFYYALLLDNGTVLRVSTQASTITSVFMTAIPVVLAIAIVTLLVCILIGHYLILQLMKPIDDMAENLEKGGKVSVYKELEPFAKKIRIQHENILAAAKNRQDFTASVSHELKTPITAISGYAELIESRIVTGDAEVHIAQQIRQNADRLLSLVTDIIQLNELDHWELPRNFEHVELLSLVQECADNLSTMADKQHVTIRCQGITAGVQAERTLIQEMIENLLQNAIRYNKPYGNVDIIVSIKKGHPIVTVKDTGIGIPSDSIDHVFERFYRVDKSRSRETGGTGLGLAIVKHIAEIHSAEISIKSELGQGTEVTIQF